MSTEIVTFDIATDVLASLKIGINELGRNMRLITAITYFSDKKLSLGKAADLAGINRLEFMDILSKKGIVIFDYDESIINSDLEAIKAI